jgi:hypothetical protein
LSEKLVQLVEAARAEGRDPRLSRIVASLEEAAIDLCHDIREDLRKLNAELEQSGIDVDRTLGEMHSDLSWYNFISRSKLNGFQAKFHGAYQTLAAFLDDIGSVLICTEAIDTMQTALSEGAILQEQLDSLIHSKKSLREMIRELSAVANAIYQRLRGGPRTSEPSPTSAPATPSGGGEARRVAPASARAGARPARSRA